MKKYLRIFLHNAKTTWMMLVIEIFSTAIVYASARASGLSNYTSIIIVCVIGTALIVIDMIIAHKFNINVHKAKSSPSKNKPSDLNERYLEIFLDLLQEGYLESKYSEKEIHATMQCIMQIEKEMAKKASAGSQKKK